MGDDLVPVPGARDGDGTGLDMLAGLGTQHCDGVEGGLPGKVLTGHLMSLMMGCFRRRLPVRGHPETCGHASGSPGAHSCTALRDLLAVLMRFNIANAEVWTTDQRVFGLFSRLTGKTPQKADHVGGPLR
jgi:hypothetical protein